MSRSSPNQYADDDRTWTTEQVQVPEDVMNIWMDMQQNSWAEVGHIKGQNIYHFNATPEDAQECYDAGYEMASRQYAQSGGPCQGSINRVHVAISMRASYGIRYPTGMIFQKAFNAGYWGFHRANEPTVAYMDPDGHRFNRRR